MSCEDCNCNKLIKLIEYIYKRKRFLAERRRNSLARIRSNMEDVPNGADAIDFEYERRLCIAEEANELECIGRDEHLLNSILEQLDIGPFTE